MENTWKAYKSRPQDPDSWEWEVSAGNLVVASRLNEINAKFIVKAVKCHDDLVRTLEEAVLLLGFYPFRLRVSLTTAFTI